MFIGFFIGWLNPPSTATHKKILEHSYCTVVAIDRDSDRVDAQSGRSQT